MTETPAFVFVCFLLKPVGSVVSIELSQLSVASYCRPAGGVIPGMPPPAPGIPPVGITGKFILL